MNIEDDKRNADEFIRLSAIATLLVIGITICLAVSDPGKKLIKLMTQGRRLTCYFPEERRGHNAYILVTDDGGYELAYGYDPSFGKEEAERMHGELRFYERTDVTSVMWPLWHDEGPAFRTSIYQPMPESEVLALMPSLHRAFLDDAKSTDRADLAARYTIPPSYSPDDGFDRVQNYPMTGGSNIIYSYGDTSRHMRWGLFMWPLFLGQVGALFFIARRMSKLALAHWRYKLYCKGTCPKCRYDLHGLTTARCPECGTPVDREAMQDE